MRKGLLGVERLNGILQAYMNPADKSKREKEYRGTIFREGDKVMQIKNNYQIEWEIRTKFGLCVDKGMGIFNGDTGIIEEINDFAETMTISFDEGRKVEYPFKLLEELELAYAVTIHKSQEVSTRRSLYLFERPENAYEQKFALYGGYKSKEMCYHSG